MTKLPQVSHERVVRALKRAGFYVLREGKHLSMTDEKHIIIVPRHHIIKPGTLKQILDAATSPRNDSKIFSEELRPSVSLATRLPTRHVSRPLLYHHKLTSALFQSSPSRSRDVGL